MNPNEQKENVDERQGKYLTFVLDKEEYGIGILKVREIIGILPITSGAAKPPPFVKGVINLRGKGDSGGRPSFEVWYAAVGIQ